MDFLFSKRRKSGPQDEKLTLDELAGTGKNFCKLVEFVREMYEKRVESLEKALSECKDWEFIDPALKAMKDFYLTEKFIQARGDEIALMCVSRESERTVDMLQAQLAKKQAEVFKLEEKLFNVKISASEGGQLSKNSGKISNFHENFRELWENEKKNNENLRIQLGVKSKELKKTQEICEENQKLMKYCEQLEAERDLFVIRNQDKHKFELEGSHGYNETTNMQVLILENKLKDQQALIEGLQNELTESKRVKIGSQGKFITEKELIEKHKMQIDALREHYEKLMEEKLRDIHKDIESNTKVVSEEKFYEVCRQKIDLENQLSATKSQTNLLNKSKSDYLSNKEIIIIENLKQELHTEQNQHKQTREKLSRYEKKLSDSESLIRKQEETIKKLQEFSAQNKKTIHTFNAFKLKKIKDSLFLLKSHLASISLDQAKSLSTIQAELKSHLITILSSLPQLHNKSFLCSLQSENQSLTAKLRVNSEAFDQLQAEVKTESLMWKQKFNEKISKITKDLKKKYEADLSLLRSECDKLKSQLDVASNTMSVNGHIIEQLKIENQNLRTDKEEIKKKQALLEEKIQIQNNNFKIQLKNKQLELDLIKKTIDQ